MQKDGTEKETWKGRAIVRRIVIAAIMVAYVGAPVDLIPDFIPVAGQIDDLIVLLLGGMGMK